MKLSEHNFNTLMMFLQQKIEDYADHFSEHLEKGIPEDFITYPPNGGLTEEEHLSLLELKGHPVLKSAMRKLMADNAAGVLFELMNLIDGTIYPDEELGEWTEISLVDRTDDIEDNEELFHDELYGKYWDWRDIRPDKSWKLDNYDETDG